ncbi:hypothetical protein ACLOJK_004664 [Asimina triloba]
MKGEEAREEPTRPRETIFRSEGPLYRLASPQALTDDTYRVVRSGREALMGHIYEHAARGGPGGSYLKLRLFGNSPLIIVVAPKFGRELPLIYKWERAKMLEKQLIMSEDFDVIREGYGIPANIVLSALAPHETSRDYRPGHLYLNEYLLGAGVRIPFDFGVAEALWAFNVSPAHVVPHSWKIIQTMAWFCECRRCLANWRL